MCSVVLKCQSWLPVLQLSSVALVALGRVVCGGLLTHRGGCTFCRWQWHLQEMERQWSGPRSLECGVVVCILLLSLPGMAMAQTTVPAIFIFGDSLSDSGNNNYINPTLSRANTPPNGLDFPGGPIATGRYTNGRTAVDIIGKLMSS